jgi:hypothetical protein
VEREEEDLQVSQGGHVGGLAAGSGLDILVVFSQLEYLAFKHPNLAQNFGVQNFFTGLTAGPTYHPRVPG